MSPHICLTWLVLRYEPCQWSSRVNTCWAGIAFNSSSSQLSRSRMLCTPWKCTHCLRAMPVENSSSRFYLISCSQGILNSSRLLLLSSPKIACLHVSFTAYGNFYKLSKMHCHLILTFLFLILRMSECRNPTIKHISTYTLVSSSITTYVTDLFLGSNLHSIIPF